MLYRRNKEIVYIPKKNIPFSNCFFVLAIIHSFVPGPSLGTEHSRLPGQNLREKKTQAAESEFFFIYPYKMLAVMVTVNVSTPDGEI
jgi:hypothetical protein